MDGNNLQIQNFSFKWNSKNEPEKLKD